MCSWGVASTSVVEGLVDQICQPRRSERNLLFRNPPRVSLIFAGVTSLELSESCDAKEAEPETPQNEEDGNFLLLATRVELANLPIEMFVDTNIIERRNNIVRDSRRVLFFDADQAGTQTP